MASILPTDSESRLETAVAEAVERLSSGEIVALPTETVYGLAADALDPIAAALIFEAKERPSFDPLICHLPSTDWLDQFCAVSEEIQPVVRFLTERFWPGPMTLVLPKRELVPDIVTSGLPTVAVRMSAHPVFAAICRRFGRPLAAPSANRFGRISPTSTSDVAAELGNRISLIVDGGPATHGIESTILGIGSTLRILRQGPITREDLIAALRTGGLSIAVEEASERKNGGEQLPEAPGQLPSHYAPRTPLRLTGDLSNSASLEMGLRVGALCFSSPPPSHAFASVEVLSPTGDLREAAAALFRKMRALDECSLDLILAEPVPERGVGAAIMDRLRRAAHAH